GRGARPLRRHAVRPRDRVRVRGRARAGRSAGGAGGSTGVLTRARGGPLRRARPAKYGRAFVTLSARSVTHRCAFPRYDRVGEEDGRALTRGPRPGLPGGAAVAVASAA